VQTRHRVDTSVWFDADEVLPPSREIEDASADLATGEPPVRTVAREPYRFSPRLVEAVNLAIGLGRPLLLQGDPGVGKTRVAHAVAYALGLPLEQAYVKSTSRGRDLLYTYDAVRRLHDVHLHLPAAQHVGPYLRLGPLGRVIARAQHGRRSVLLIDEIDKADLDFPNDLLHELDELAFSVEEDPEQRYAVPPDQPRLRPIIVVTNNEEKTLPGAFLRRCVFHYLEFPADARDLDAILQLHGIDGADLRDAVIRVAQRLGEIDFTRRPGLSELLDWAGYLTAMEIPAGEVEGLPYLGALLKHQPDQIRARGRVSPP
jgi:MoxR-like ATPase